MTTRNEASRLRRNLLVAGAAAFAGVYGRPTSNAHAAGHGGSKPHDLVNVHDFRTDTGADWTAAANAATAVAARVYFPAGEYMLNAANWPSDTEIFGDGDATILRVSGDADYLFTCDSGSSLVEQNVTNLYMHDLQLRGTCDIDGFAEYKHLVSLNGVSNVRFRHVLFRGFRGDGLYIGSGNRPGIERHNTDVVVENCRFDGINNANRNAITIIDCDRLLVTNNVFENTTAPHMPGAVDIEPNKYSFPIVRNLTVANNQFRRIGGFTGIVAVSVPSTVSMPPTNILVEGNTATDCTGRGAFFFFNTHRAVSAESPDNKIVVRQNIMRGGGKPFMLTGKRIVVQGNVFEDLRHTGRIGSTKDIDTAVDVELVNNTFLRCGSVEGYGVALHTADHVRFIGNRFVDCGTGTLPRASAVVFGKGRSSNVTFDRNEFSSPTGKTLSAIARDAGHTLQVPTNRFIGNQLNGLSVHFQASAGNST
ncbi:MAG TPA: right-handed parallel beta-helix repeat-containing protein [Noviherbaspirillum sp.]